MKKRIIFPLVGFVLTLAACFSPSAIGVSPSEDPASPESILRQFETAANAKDLDTLMTLCEEDAVFGTIQSARWTDMETNWASYIASDIELEISNIQTTDEITTLQIKWFSVNKYISTQTWEATFEAGKIKTLLFLEEIDKASG
jgi:hypothetical protein